MIREISNKLLIQELKVLEIALKNNGVLTQRDLEKNNLNEESLLDALGQGYLEIEQKNVPPYRIYKMTKEGGKYFREILNLMRDYNESKNQD